MGPKNQMAGFVEDVVVGIFKPGTNAATFQFLNYVLVALFFSIVSMIVTGSGSYHVWVLLFLAVGLFASVNWFMAELANAPTEESEPGAAAPKNKENSKSNQENKKKKNKSKK
eukprot:TRINITY_DN4139_c0_g1_i3.p1 TRINITY_DN4139_c0_g1~~TRINITY_DN4139_c0_g1_i3.p1  ORF type:complete len:123 (+),score=34.37 TRINITY_DN4139_c0_g1_i3:32-370(+)